MLQGGQTCPGFGIKWPCRARFHCACPTCPAYPDIESDSTQESVKPKSTCLAPKASTIKEQGFSEVVAARIKVHQRESTRSVCEAKWTIFTKWCLSDQVDFRARKLQSSTIDGYRSAIADKLDNLPINISKDENLTLVHRERPKRRRGIPSWNLSLVLHQMTKAPFELVKEATLKHLTFKTAFLLALGSGKRRSEIHAWQNKNIRHQSDWSMMLPITHLSFQEPAGQRWCGPSGYSSPGPNSG